MAGIGVQELLLIVIAIAIPIGLGRALAHRIADDKRKIIGGIALFIAVILAFSGISSCNSAISQEKAVVGVVVTYIGILLGLFGIVMLASNSRQVSS